MSLKNWFRNLLRVVRNYDSDREALRARINHVDGAVTDLNVFLRCNTDVAVDVGFREMSTVIIAGSYNGHDYVQSYHLPADDMKGLIDHLRNLEQRCAIKRLDAPPSFRSFMLHEIGKF